MDSRQCEKWAGHRGSKVVNIAAPGALALTRATTIASRHQAVASSTAAQTIATLPRDDFVIPCPSIIRASTGKTRDHLANDSRLADLKKQATNHPGGDDDDL